MTRIFVLVLVTISFAANTANAACDSNTIKGNYAVSGVIDSFGFVGDGRESNLIFLMGRFTFDGIDKVTVKNAKLSIAGEFLNAAGSGSYKVDSNCVGVATFRLKLKEAGIQSKIRLDIIVSGTSKVPEIDAVYSDIQFGGESGLLTLKKIRL